MAPGGGLRSEAPIKRHWTFVGGIGEAPVEVVPDYQFWWKFDEASGLFHDSVSDAATMTGSSYAVYHQSPLAPDSTYSVRTVASIETAGMVIPAITPGPTGWIVFDWWVKDLTTAFTSGNMTATIFDFNSTDSPDGVSNGRVAMHFVMASPSYTKKLCFSIGSSGTDRTHDILTITSWDNPAHFQWKINPTADTWTILMGGTVLGSGTRSPWSWGGLWGAEFAALDDPAYFDEFKAYGE
jgi:hypothetical protein